MLREMGLEPTRPCGHKILSLACLPFQHSRAIERYYHTVDIFQKNSFSYFSKKLVRKKSPTGERRKYGKNWKSKIDGQDR